MSSRIHAIMFSLCLQAFFTTACMAQSVVPTEKVIDGKTYVLDFNDEFDGNTLDNAKWKPRMLGPNPQRSMVFTDDASWLDGQGNLVMAVYTIPHASLSQEIEPKFKPMQWIPCTSVLRTPKEFTFGYHEVRLMMPIAKGVGMSVWLQSNGQTQKNPSPDPKVGAEIDLIEQTFFDKQGNANDYKHSTIHWGGYKDTHQFISITVDPKSMQQKHTAGQDAELNLPGKEKKQDALIREKRSFFSDDLNFRDEQFHTIGLLWTPDCYKFYYDGICIGTITEGVSHAPGYMILWPRLFNFPELVGNSETGMGDKDTTHAKYLVDYYRVYQAK